MSPLEFQVQLFLANIKETITKGNFFVVERNKNNSFLAAAGMTPKERERIVLSLESNHYIGGPRPDHSNPNEDIWEFKIRYDDKDLYIKLKLVLFSGKYIGKCISFHECEK